MIDARKVIEQSFVKGFSSIEVDAQSRGSDKDTGRRDGKEERGGLYQGLNELLYSFSRGGGSGPPLLLVLLLFLCWCWWLCQCHDVGETVNDGIELGMDGDSMNHAGRNG